MNADPARRVIKLGGSLLDLPDLGKQFHRWLSVQTQAVNLLLVGGGAIVDEIRRLDQLHGLGEEACHWLAVRGMQLNADAIDGLLMGAGRWVAGDLIPLPPVAGLYVVDSLAFAMWEQEQPDPLPRTWQATSDALAARLATLIAADELVVCKSALPANDANVQDAASAGYVDPLFLQRAKDLTVRLVNLRDTGFAERRI